MTREQKIMWASRIAEVIRQRRGYENDRIGVGEVLRSISCPLGYLQREDIIIFLEVAPGEDLIIQKPFTYEKILRNVKSGLAQVAMIIDVNVPTTHIREIR